MKSFLETIKSRISTSEEDDVPDVILNCGQEQVIEIFNRQIFNIYYNIIILSNIIDNTLKRVVQGRTGSGKSTLIKITTSTLKRRFVRCISTNLLV